MSPAAITRSAERIAKALRDRPPATELEWSDTVSRYLFALALDQSAIGVCASRLLDARAALLTDNPTPADPWDLGRFQRPRDAD